MMRRAARRDVDVRLILQGEPDMPIVKTAARMLYHHLLNAGVRIFEYCDRPLHGKVALVDDNWSTVGSSNLDPLSLSLNLESNVDRSRQGFQPACWSERLEGLMRHRPASKSETSDLTEWSHAGRDWCAVSFGLLHLLRVVSLMGGLVGRAMQPSPEAAGGA